MGTDLTHQDDDVVFIAGDDRVSGLRRSPISVMTRQRRLCFSMAARSASSEVSTPKLSRRASSTEILLHLEGDALAAAEADGVGLEADGQFDLVHPPASISLMKAKASL